MQRTTSMKTIAVCRNTAHGMHRYRTPDHFLVLIAMHVGPGDWQREIRFERGIG